MMKSRSFITLLMLLSATWFNLASAATEAVMLDRVVAIVDNDVITYREYQQEVEAVQEKIARQGAGIPPEELVSQQAMRRAILSKLQMNQARKLGIDIDDSQLATAISNIASRNQLSLDDMQAMLASEGINFDEYREDLRQQITISRLHQREVVDKIQISDAQVDAYLANSDALPGGKTAVHLRHILLATPEGASSDAIDARAREAEQLKSRLLAGDDFTAAAINLSDGRQAVEGGDLGWLTIEQAPSIFLEAIRDMDRGDIAGPIQSSSGFHIIKLEDFRGGERSMVDQTHVRHILIRTDELTSNNDAQNRLEQLHQRITGGDDFAALARSHSSDKTSAIKGGDLGWISPGDVVPEFEKVMAGLDINEMSQPFKTQFGWHIVQVLDRRTQDVTEEARREKARAALRKQRSDEALELYLRKLLDQAYIENYLEQ
ncbi:MAG: peptidylprolyl isomerase [bacterium]